MAGWCGYFKSQTRANSIVGCGAKNCAELLANLIWMFLDTNTLSGSIQSRHGKNSDSGAVVAQFHPR